jgi:antitoxin YefM
MTTLSIAEAGRRLDGLVDEAIRDRAPIFITRDSGGGAVLLAEEEYAAIEETLHLFSTPANAGRLREGLGDYAAGKLQPGALCD